MCGRFVVEIPFEDLQKIFTVIEKLDIGPRYNIAPTQQAAIVRSTDDHNELVPMKWGLIPSWSKDTKIAAHTINARSETVAEKPAFRHAIKVHRCIVPTSGFYEWSQKSLPKQPYYIHMADGSPMCFAGIWEYWKAPDGDPLETFSILTTTANELIEPLHDRMPVILHPENYGLWLDKDMLDPKHLEHLYAPYPADQLSMYRVSPLVNSPRNQGPECIEQI